MKAKWTEVPAPVVKHTVTFDTDGGSEVASVEVVEGDKVTKPADPTKEGCEFNGWFVGEGIYDFDAPVKADITLIAKWTRLVNFVSTEAELRTAIDDAIPTIRLTNDITATENISLSKGQKLTIDLNGKNVSIGDKRILIDAYGDNRGANVSVIGNGKISSTGNFIFLIKGASDEADTDKCYLSIGKDVTLDGNYAVSVAVEDGKKACYGVTVDIYGTLKGEQPVYVNGYINNQKDAPQINIHENAKILGKTTETSKDPAIYIAGYSTVVIDKNAEIIGDANAIEIAAGKLEINGAILTGANIAGYNPGFGGSITSDTGSAIYIKQHTTNQPLEVVVNDGKFKAFVPFFQQKGQNATPNPDVVKLSISGGEFVCTSTATTGEKLAVQSYDKTKFITGGTFSIEPKSEYIADGYKAQKNGENWEVVAE